MYVPTTVVVAAVFDGFIVGKLGFSPPPPPRQSFLVSVLILLPLTSPSQNLIPPSQNLIFSLSFPRSLNTVFTLYSNSNCLDTILRANNICYSPVLRSYQVILGPLSTKLNQLYTSSFKTIRNTSLTFGSKN